MHTLERLKILIRNKNGLKLGTLSIILVIVGLFNFRKFGISWEAPGLRLNGGSAAIYVADKFGLNVVPEYYRQFPAMGENGMADHGVAYDLPLVILERLFGISDSMQIYQFRSLINFCVYIVGTLSVYQLAKRRFTSTNIGLLAAIFFILSPRIFAAGFYSPSDMVFTSFFALGANLSIQFIKDQRIVTALFAGMVCGFATDIRLLGIIALPIFTFAYIFYNYRTRSQLIRPMLTYLISFSTSIYVFFPYLWENPFGRFLEVFKSLSRYNWGGKNLYFGEFISASDLPWHYIPVWILITTPVFYSVLFLLGFFVITRKTLASKVIGFDTLQDYIFLGLAVLPVLMVITLNSVLYDSWRHLFFVYPFFILVAIIGWVNLFSKRETRIRLYALKVLITALCLSQIFAWMILNNPRQYLYFNFLAGHSNLQEKWEMDYLGLSNKDVIENLLKEDNGRQISVGIASFTPFDMSLRVVPENLRDRMVILSLDEKPDYIVNNFRATTPVLKEKLVGYSLDRKYTIDESTFFEVWKRD